MMQPISAPILVPGTQQEPTTPSLSATSNSNRIASLGSGALYHPNHNSRDLYHHAVGPGSSSTLLTAHHLSSSISHTIGTNIGNNPDSGLKRFPSFGNTKRLSAENQTMRAKIAELERYLTGLKEELILAHRQIHAKNLEAKISQERKAVEIHELGQHIQRCEFDLLAKMAECEALQNKLQYQTKEQMTKLKHINLLENEIMDYRRMSIMSGGNSGGGASGPLTGGSLGGFRNSRNSAELSESVRSSTILQDGSSISGSAGGHNNNNSHQLSEITTVQMKELKEENARKDEKIQALVGQLEKLQADLVRLEKQRVQEASETAIVTAAAASAVAAASIAGGDKIMLSNNNNNNSDHQESENSNDGNGDTVSNSTSNQSFNTASAHGLGSGSVASTITHGHPSTTSMASSINSVGYDMSVEHPKLVARYQALRMQHAQASEYVNNLEFENRDLKVQLLDVTAIPSSVSPTLPTTTMSTFSSSFLNNNNLYHHAASGLTPLDTDLSNDHYHHTRESTFLDSPSPTSATASVGSPSTVVAPVLTQKSALRYSRDGRVSPSTTSATAAPETTMSA